MDSAPLALIVPYRDRQEHLAEFLPAITRFLTAAGAHFTVVVVEQTGRRPFNRGKLLNVGFHFCRDSAAYFCLHDVDLLPEHETCDYSFEARPTQLATYLSQNDYQPAGNLFGGVTLLRRDDFAAINGFSNGYWGWGGEDNDLLHRCRRQGLGILHKEGVYRSLWHKSNNPVSWGVTEEDANDRRLRAALTGELDPQRDGLSDLAYSVREHHALACGARLISVDI